MAAVNEFQTEYNCVVMKAVILVASLLIIGFIEDIHGLTENAACNLDSSDKEFWDGDKFCVNITLGAKTNEIDVIISPQNNRLLQCKTPSGEDPICVSYSSAFCVYKETETLKFCMKLNCTEYSRNELIVNRNELDKSNQTIPILPCRSGFKANAVRNGKNVTFTCEHKDFNFSKSGIKIALEGGNTLAQCKWNRKCTGAKAIKLTNGIQWTTEHKTALKYICDMDGQSVLFSYTEPVTPGTLHSGIGRPNKVTFPLGVLLVFLVC